MLKLTFYLAAICCLLPAPFLLNAQQTPRNIDRGLPEFSLTEMDVKPQMYFLASDYLAGRRTGSVGNEVAAAYISAQLQAYGYQPLPGADDGYYQNVYLESSRAPERMSMTLGDMTFTHPENLIVVRGDAIDKKAEVVFANYGWVDEKSGYNDYAELDVKGKIVITLPGLPDVQGQAAIFQGFREKGKMAQDAGAVALVELYQMPFPWTGFLSYFGGETMGLAKDKTDGERTIPYGFIKPEDIKAVIAQLKGKKKMKGELVSTGVRTTPVFGRNVAGMIEGSDPELKDEYLLLTAHYDHVGTGKQGGGAYTPEDSIFNGARDNAFGLISMLAAARSFAQAPPRRSVIVLAVTGEEMGLLGSSYYAKHPLVPLENTFYNFNTDGAGYNDTTVISIFGYGRTGVDAQLDAGTAAFGLDIVENPAEEQGLYDRSDNVSFAVKGVPALTFSAGFREFNDEIFKYYHQVSDNPETIDYAYLTKYCQAFTLCSRLIADMDGRPFWSAGDKYEAAGKLLYGRE